MPCRLSTRHLTPEERRRLGSRWYVVRETATNLLMAFLLSLVVGLLCCLAGLLSGSLLDRILGSEGFRSGAGAFGLLTPILPLWIYLFVKFQKAMKAQRGGPDPQVDVLEIDAARYVRNEAETANSPEYYFDLGDRKVLLLSGQWLWDPDTFGLETPEEDDDKSESEVPFPSRAFVVHRMRTGGLVLRIEILGDRIPPEGEFTFRTSPPKWVSSCAHRMDWICSLILEGDFEELAKLATLRPKS